tara:strand:+ start:79574 stop:80002 length:429 start_codon:yes stop_codon:yes gene_type:complete
MRSRRKKVEIIDIDINLNIEEEINKKVESLKSDIVVHTKGFIERAKLKKQKSSKKAKNTADRDEKIGKALKYLETAFSEARDVDEFWVEGNKLMDIAGIDVTPQNLSKFSLQLRNALKNSDKWSFSKKRKARKTYYRLEKFD